MDSAAWDATGKSHESRQGGDNSNARQGIRKDGSGLDFGPGSALDRPVDAFGQVPNWQQQIERNRQQGAKHTWETPSRLVRELTPVITDLDPIGVSVPTFKRSDPFRLRVEWTEDAAIVNRMSELGSARDGFCIVRTSSILSDVVVGRYADGTPMYGTISDRVVEDDCYDSGDRFREFEVPGNTNTVDVRVQVRFGSLSSRWSETTRSEVLAQ